MSQEAVERLAEDIEDKIGYYRQEYEMTYAEAIGVLEMCKLNLFQEAIDDDKE